MTPDSSNAPISAEALARKMKAVRNFALPTLQAQLERQPRLEEVLWHLQWISSPENYPGGLARFVADFIADSADMIGTAKMRELIATGAKITPAAARTIYEDLPSDARVQLGCAEPPEDAWEDALDDPPVRSSVRDLWKDPHVRMLLNYGEREEAERWVQRQERARERDKDRAARHRHEEALLAGTDLAAFRQLCARRAHADLADYLRCLCDRDYVHFGPETDCDYPKMGQAPWYFVDVATALLRFIDRRKSRIAATIAETEVTREMRTWLDIALRERRAVRIVGNSRFGKTEFAKTWCWASPGLARLVSTPDSNSESDLLRAVASALGIEPWQTTARLRAAIEFVLKHSGLFIVFDEAHLILPTRFSRTTAPARLNWVRRNVMDAGIGCAFIATPQGYESARRKYLGKTGYAIEQFEERILKTVKLPEVLSEADLLGIARIHLPALAEDYLAHVVDKVLLARRSFVSDLEKVATLSRHFATAAGKPRPGLAELNAAISEILPSADPSPVLRQPTEAAMPAPARRQKRTCTTVAKAVRDAIPTPGLKAPSRINFDQLTPAESPLGAPA